MGYVNYFTGMEMYGHKPTVDSILIGHCYAALSVVVPVVVPVFLCPVVYRYSKGIARYLNKVQCKIYVRCS